MTKGPDKHPSVVLILMSHGGKAGINGTDGISVKVEDIKKQVLRRELPRSAWKTKDYFSFKPAVEVSAWLHEHLVMLFNQNPMYPNILR